MFDINGKDNSNYNLENIELIKKASPTVGAFIEGEYNRQKNNVELIASENYCSEAILAACGSCLSWKYAEGYPYVRTSGNTSRYYGGTEFVDQLEEYAAICGEKYSILTTMSMYSPTVALRPILRLTRPS